MNITLDDIRNDIQANVKAALTEDIGDGDITAMLIPETQNNTATIVTREECVVCGIAWAEETFAQLGGLDKITWHISEGDKIPAGTTLATLQGNARILLTGERTALNFLQLLSAIATKAERYTAILDDPNIHILDTRKTLPGLRNAQKYAVNIGGCHNHRIGLYDAFLIKENHILACGGITAAILRAKEIAPGKMVEVETETLEELQEAITAGADVAMLDNFSEDALQQAILLDRKQTKYELSGNLNLSNLESIKGLAIDYCSFGDLTKNVLAIDLSMRMK